jgi:chemotaxis signal transduction protein
MTERTPHANRATAVDLACFELADRSWAVPIARVREILATPAITPLPDAPACIEGLMALRGTLIPVLDLAGLVGAPEPTPGSGGRTVVVEACGLVFGFRVDRATQVLAADATSTEILPPPGSGGSRVVGAIVRRGDRSPVLVLDLESIVLRVAPSVRTDRAEGEVAA